MGGDEDDAQPAGRQHHRDRDIAGDMCQELGDSREPIPGRVQRGFVDRARDDRIDFAGEREPGGSFDALRRRATGLDLIRRSVFQTSAPDDPHFGIQGLAQGFAHDLRANPTWVPHSNRQARPVKCHRYSLMSM